MAIGRVGCCTQLLYETTRASKNAVKVALTPAMLHGRATATVFAALSGSASIFLSSGLG